MPIRTPLRTAVLKVAATGLVAALVWPRCNSDGVAGTWQARSALVYYDHLESIELEGGGRGRASWGWEQHVHFDGRFSYEVASGRIALRYASPPPVSGTKRDLSYSVDRGSYTFERSTPTGRVEKTRCDRRLTFDDTPFPPGFAKARQYFGGCRTVS